MPSLEHGGRDKRHEFGESGSARGSQGTQLVESDLNCRPHLLEPSRFRAVGKAGLALR